MQLLKIHKVAKDSNVFVQLKRNADLKQLSNSIEHVSARGCMLCSIHYTYITANTNFCIFGQGIRHAPAIELADVIAGNMEAPIAEKVSARRPDGPASTICL